MNRGEQIVLISGELRELLAAPDGFDWNNYPAAIIHNGIPFHYVGTTEGTPHYRLALVE